MSHKKETCNVYVREPIYDYIEKIIIDTYNHQTISLKNIAKFVHNELYNKTKDIPEKQTHIQTVNLLLIVCNDLVNQNRATYHLNDDTWHINDWFKGDLKMKKSIENAKTLNKKHLSTKTHISGISMYEFTSHIDELISHWQNSKDFSELVWLLPLVETHILSKSDLIAHGVSEETIEILYTLADIKSPFAHDAVLNRNHHMIHTITYATCLYNVYLLQKYKSNSYSSDLLLRTNQRRVDKLEKYNNSFNIRSRTKLQNQFNLINQ